MSQSRQLILAAEGSVVFLHQSLCHITIIGSPGKRIILKSDQKQDMASNKNSMIRI